MSNVKGFKNKKEALNFIKDNGKGILASKNDRKPLYDAAKILYGIDTKLNKYCVFWSEK